MNSTADPAEGLQYRMSEEGTIKQKQPRTFQAACSLKTSTSPRLFFHVRPDR